MDFCNANKPDIANADVTLVLNRTLEVVTVHWTCVTGHVFSDDDAKSRTGSCTCSIPPAAVSGACVFKTSGIIKISIVLIFLVHD